MIVRKINAEELKEVHSISALSFHWSLDAKDKTPAEYAAMVAENPGSRADVYWQETWAAFTGEGEMMSTLCAIPYRIYFDGNETDMTGIGNVCTYPQHRRKGAVKALFVKMLEEAYEKKVPFSYLYPFSEQFYGNFGYIRSCDCRYWDFGLRVIPDYRAPGSFHLYKPGGDYGEFLKVYRAFAKDMNMMVVRDGNDWGVIKAADPFKGDRSAFMYKDETGAPAGYLIFEKRVAENGRRLLNCQEIAFTNFAALKALMAFAKTFASDYDAIAFTMSSSLDLSYFCADYHQSASARQVRSWGMSRVINAYEALRLARYKGEGSLSLLLRDPFLAQNSGLYRIDFEADRAKRIDFTPVAADAPGQADVEMTIQLFSASLLGDYDVQDWAYMDGAALRANRDAAERVFYKKPCWINNYF